MINGVNHITIAVSNIEQSFQFYVDVLGMRPHAKWTKGAYLSLNDMWFCLSLDKVQPAKDYTHIAFDVAQAQFTSVKDKILQSGVIQWKENKSEGDSLYFLDPNGHKLELHVGSLKNRLEFLATKPYDGLKLFG